MDEVNEETDDKVFAYSSLVISCGLLYSEFCDSIKEGDGLRVLRCWRYMFLLFKATNRVNYSIEAFTMLAQYEFLFSQRQHKQLLWSRFVNVHGLPARNIPCDLFMEHLNRVCKEAVNDLKSNKTTTSLVKVVGVLDEVVKKFNQNNGVPNRYGTHDVAACQKDVEKVSLLLQEQVLQHKATSRHHFQKFVKIRFQSWTMNHS